MSLEGQLVDQKSLRVLKDGYRDLARDCVAFANAQGGTIKIGIEDGEQNPPATQRVEAAMQEALEKRIPLLTANVALETEIITAVNGGQYLDVKVFPSRRNIASTTDGHYFIRVSDECRPLMPEDLYRVLAEKSAYNWELDTSMEVAALEADVDKRREFLGQLRRSARVSPFLKEKPDGELLEHYSLVDAEKLTNLGVLWIGQRKHRARLHHAPSVQCIKYDEVGKVNKWMWTDFSLNPMELIEAIWAEVPDWRESQEFPDGLYRTNIPHYDEAVVRELLANALVHRPYTQAGDVFLNLYPDRMEIHNPGLLPLGVTPTNILHATVKRNEHLAAIFYDLELMEQEGSGYDRLYEVLLAVGKPLPQVSENHDRVTITIHKRVSNPSILDFIGKAERAFKLSQRERITLGLLAQRETITAAELCEAFDLKHSRDVRYWIGRLTEWKLVRTRGRTKGLCYFVEPEMRRQLEIKGTNSLKVIHAPQLRELILNDLSTHVSASRNEIHRRIGLEIPIRQVRSQLSWLVSAGALEKTGTKRGVRYLRSRPGETSHNVEN